MKILGKKYILFILLGVLFFSVQIDKAKAEVGCQGSTGCKNIVSQDPITDAANCQNSCASFDIGGDCVLLNTPCPLVTTQQPQFGCQGNLGCKNITAGSFESAAFVCQNSCASLNIGGNCVRLAAPCPPEVAYGCIKNEECKTISADSVETANKICANFCGDNADYCSSILTPCPPPVKQWGCVQDSGCQNIESMYYLTAKKSCQGNITADPCPAGGTVAGTSATDLKNQARSVLNKANFSGPTDIINRAIKILLAFIGSIALVLYIYSGFLWMTASGGSEQVEKAKTTIVWTTLGVVMMLASYILASFIFSSLGV